MYPPPTLITSFPLIILARIYLEPNKYLPTPSLLTGSTSWWRLRWYPNNSSMASPLIALYSWTSFTWLRSCFSWLYCSSKSRLFWLIFLKSYNIECILFLYLQLISIMWYMSIGFLAECVVGVEAFFFDKYLLFTWSLLARSVWTPSGTSLSNSAKHWSFEPWISVTSSWILPMSSRN